MCRRRGTGRSPTSGCPRRRWRCRASRRGRHWSVRRLRGQHPGVNCPSTVPGCVRRGKRRSGRDKARRISGSYSFVAALTSPVEVAFCVLARLHAAKPVQQVFRHHQEVVRLLQTPGFRVLVELVNAVEGLELNARAAVQLGERHMLMHLVNHRLRALVAVGVAGEKRRAVLQQDVIHRPSVDGQAVDVRILRKRCLDARLDVLENALDVPGIEMPVFALHSVREAVNLVCLERAVRLDADDVPPGRCTDVNRQKNALHEIPPRQYAKEVSHAARFSGD